MKGFYPTLIFFCDRLKECDNIPAPNAQVILLPFLSINKTEVGIKKITGEENDDYYKENIFRAIYYIGGCDALPMGALRRA